MEKRMVFDRSSIQRKRVAKEAAELLYTGQEKEYRQAKLRAAKNLGFRILPSNAEIAIQLDSIAQEKEGRSRNRRLAQMRQEALEVMQILEGFSPRLVGSVWRGTSHHNSDIDIAIYTQEPQEIVTIFRKKNYSITCIRTETATKEGERRSSTHIYVDLPSGNQVEIVARNPEDANRQAKCEIYGDDVTGLTTLQLQQVLSQDAQKKFVP